MIMHVTVAEYTRVAGKGLGKGGVKQGRHGWCGTGSSEMQGR
mgnify:CR=1 FL=1